MLLSFQARNRSVSFRRAIRPIQYSQVVVFFVAGLLVTGLLRPCMAQEPGDGDVIRVRTDLVTVPTIVADSKGRRVFGLAQADFTVQVDGRNVKLDHFSTGTDRVVLAFLLDASGSARDYLTKQREAALALFSRFGTGSQIAVVRFSDKVDLAVPFTDDIANARSGFDFPAVVGRHTAIFDSAVKTIQMFAQRKNDPTERHIIILTSDGLDTASTTKASDVIRRAQAAGISLYVIHFPLFVPTNGHLGIRPTAKGFRELADKTGGSYFIAGDVKSALDPNAQYDLSSVFKSIEEDLASQYLLGFYPTAESIDGRWHQISVGLGHRKRAYDVRAFRDGYSLKN